MIGTNAIELTLAVSAGAVTGAPYFWNGTNWCPLHGDAATGVVDDQADFASVAVAHETYRRAAEPRWFAVLKTGAGTLTYCDLAEAVL